jgi:hypothetical protein
MPARLCPAGRIFRYILERIACARGHVRSLLVLSLVTIDALDCKDALPIHATTQTKESVRATILTLQRRIPDGVTIDATRMHENLVRMHKGFTGAGIVANLLVANLSTCARSQTDRQTDHENRSHAKP